MLQQASELTHGELHQEFSELAFFQALRECLSTCGYTDFSWRDLYAPTSKRLRHQLSAIINLAKFREEQIKVYGELNEPVRYCVTTVMLLVKPLFYLRSLTHRG